MARFLTAPRRQMVNPYPEVNVDFYSNLMNQTQQNLNQATQMQSQALDYIYNLPVYSEEDRASVITPAEEKFQSMLDSEFISPSQVAGTIMDVRREIQPGVQALQAKSKAAEMYDKLKLQYGVNALMGTDPRSLSIKTQEGSWRDPSQFRASGVNMGDIDKLFLQSQTSNLNKPGGISYIVGKGIDVNGVPEGVIQTVESKGLSEQERNRLYHPNSPYARQLAESQLQSMPELLDVTGGDKEKALQAIINRNWSTSGSYKQDVNYGSMGDPSYTKPETEIPTTIPTPGRRVDVAAEGIAQSTVKGLSNILTGISNPEALAIEEGYKKEVVGALGKTGEIILNIPNIVAGGLTKNKNSLYQTPDLSPKTPEEIREKSIKALEGLKSDKGYSMLYGKVEEEVSSIIPKDFPEYEAKVNEEFIKRVIPIETGIRMLSAESTQFTPSELPKLFSDVMTPKGDGKMPLRVINNNGELGDYIDQGDMYNSKGDLKPEFEQASITVNPFNNRIILHSTNKQRSYEIEVDKLDKDVKTLLNYLKSINNIYIESIKSGNPSEEAAEKSRQFSDILMHAIYVRYSNDNSKENQQRKEMVNNFVRLLGKE